MNLKSEQITEYGEIVIDYDERISNKEKVSILQNSLGTSSTSFININKKKILTYTGNTGEKTCFFYASVTYLGGNGQHPVFKKRMQLPKWYKEYAIILSKNGYDVRFLGIYKYGKNIIFVDFIKDTYMQKKMNNSAAHVYINDLYQAFTNDIFNKIDSFGNEIVCIKNDILKGYIDNTVRSNNTLLSIFADFNQKFPFKTNIYSLDAIKEMHINGWVNWRQAEWAGWYLEYIFDTYIESNQIEHIIKYVGDANKKKDSLDFDILFVQDHFMGDLKASNAKYNEVILNDQSNLIHSLETFGRFWYVIYEHSTIKDADYSGEFVATRARNWYIKECDKISDKDFDEYSYSGRMKHSISFERMLIVEINKANYNHILSDFSQGKQPSGAAREKKYKLKKSEIDNFVIYRYNKK